MPQSKWPANEAEMGAVVVAWLQAQAWDVYQEVASDGCYADIVARRANVIWVIECKCSLSMAVMAQAVRWVGRCHMVSVAIPKTCKKPRERWFAERVLKDWGIGLMEASPAPERLPMRYRITEPVAVHETIRPNFLRAGRRSLKLWDNRLCERQKTFAPAGVQAAPRWTPFRATCEAVLDYVQRNPGTTPKALMSAIQTHYSTPASGRAAILKGIERGYVPGIRIQKQGRDIALWPL